MASRLLAPDTAFSLAKSARQRRPRIQEKSHLAFIRTLPCCICGVVGRTEAAHIRAASARHGKRAVGGQEKPDDRWSIPACVEHHREQHASAELEFWARHGINPFDLAQSLRLSSGQEEEALLILRETREAART